MNKLILFILVAFVNLFAQGQVVETTRMKTWMETFGDKNDPAVLLIMGGFCQGILWPTEFCEALASEGFYVIRYDQRDTGLSTCVDFKKEPYDLLDMAKDGVAILDYLQIDKAHLCSLSMGGCVAELISIHYPSRVIALTLISTSSDMRPCSLAYDELPSTGITLPRPTDEYLAWMQKFLTKAPKSFEEALDQRVECWSILNGRKTPFDEERYRELHTEFLKRCVHPESLTNHLDAIRLSFDIILEAPAKVTHPTTVLHGTEDPILLPIHGETLARLIPHSKFHLLEGYGHVPNKHFYSDFIKAIKEGAN